MSVKQVIAVEGMKCCHCEAHMEKAFQEIDGVIAVKADHEKKEVVVESAQGLSAELAKKTVESQNKTFLGIYNL